MTSHCRTKYKLSALFAAVLILIMVCSIFPMEETLQKMPGFRDSVFSMIQNLMHMPMYAVLTIVSLKYFECIRYSRKKGIVLGIIIAMSVGVLNEILQNFVPGRYGSLTDIVLNAIGIIAGMILYVKTCQKTLD